jgi:hypothetical protein
MLRRMALVRIEVSQEHIAFIIRVKGIGELGTLALSSSRSVFGYICHPNDGDTFLRHVFSYNKRTA